MLCRAAYAEVEEIAIGASELRANTGIGWLKPVSMEAWPPLPDAFGEGVNPVRIHRVVFLGNPFHVGTEAGLVGEVQGEVDAQAAGFGQGVDQGVEGVFAGIAEINTPGQPLFRAGGFR